MSVGLKVSATKQWALWFVPGIPSFRNWQGWSQVVPMLRMFGNCTMDNMRAINTERKKRSHRNPRS